MPPPHSCFAGQEQGMGKEDSAWPCMQYSCHQLLWFFFPPKQALSMYSRYGTRLNTYPCFCGSYTEHQETLPAADQGTKAAQEPPRCWFLCLSSLPVRFCFRRDSLVLLPALASVIARLAPLYNSGWEIRLLFQSSAGLFSCLP